MKFNRKPKYGRLTALYVYGIRLYKRHKRPMIMCLCDCGVKKVVDKQHLIHGRTVSCGCFRNEQVRCALVTHGQTGTKEYMTWGTMLARCNNPNNKRYHRYGGRGITVCERWHDFQNFFDDMGKCPRKSWSIDRIDNDGNYEPGNCRWASTSTQANNTSRSMHITFQGRTMSQRRWADELGIPQATLSQRITRHGVEKAMKMPYKPYSTPRKPSNELYEHDGKSMTLKEWAEFLGIQYKTLHARIRVSGMSFEKAISFHR